MLRKVGFLTAVSVLALAGCEERETVLTGQRLDVRALSGQAVAAEAQVNASRPLSAAPARANADWAQSHVSSHVRASHPTLSDNLAVQWSTSIGAGDSRRNRLNVDPVVSDGRIFTVDAANVVRATSTAGEALWSYDLTPERDNAQHGQGGGLAVAGDRLAGDRLFVASGFGTLSALDATSGEELWTQKLGASATGAPSHRDGLVYVVSGDQVGWAIEAETGRVRWQIEGQSRVGTVAGAPAPAISDQYVTFAFGDGSLTTVFRKGGLQLWTGELPGRRKGLALANINDVTGDPVVAHDRVYAGTHAGQLVAFSLPDGERLWSRPQGALGPVWATSNDLGFISDRNRLVRVAAAPGAKVWDQPLPGYVPVRNPGKKRESSYVNFGPILAGGRLVVAGSDGQLRSFDPKDGALISSVEIPGGATTRPVIAGGTLYVVSGKGVLHAFR
jgi:outer membrane protein assembly factor BamB